jgi:hypothetical protein
MILTNFFVKVIVNFIYFIVITKWEKKWLVPIPILEGTIPVNDKV